MRAITVTAFLAVLFGCSRQSEDSQRQNATARTGSVPITLESVLEYPAVACVMTAVNDSDGDEFFTAVQEYVSWSQTNRDSALSSHFKSFTSWIEGDYGYGTTKNYLSAERITELEDGVESVAMVIDISIVGASLAHLAVEGSFPKDQWQLVSRVLERQCDPRVDSYFCGDGSRRKAMLSARAALEAALE